MGCVTTQIVTMRNFNAGYILMQPYVLSDVKKLVVKMLLHFADATELHL